MYGWLMWLFGRIRPRPPVPPTPTPTPDPNVDFAAEALRLTNDIRSRVNVLPMARSLPLDEDARGHSEAMHAAGSLWHAGSDGTPESRARAVGYPYAVGENGAMGCVDAGQAVAKFRGDSPHYDNLVDRDYDEMGAANVGGFVTFVFGASYPASSRPPSLMTPGADGRSYATRPSR